ncbi:MAG: azurin [Steroidobacterales bacterium]
MKKYPWFAALALIAAAPFASAKTCSVAIEGNDQMQFNLKEIKVDADCTEVEVTLSHPGKFPAAAMGHNWVLAKSEDLQAIVNAGATAGLDNNYLPKGDARIIASTRIIGGGESTSVKFRTSKLTKGGDYEFFCSFPGHWAIMHGKFLFG